MLGYENEIPVSMADMLHHTAAVTRGAKHALVVGDMPFLCYATPDAAVANAGRFLPEAGAQAVKVEGGVRSARTIEAIVKAGIPTMGHIGWTPQAANAAGKVRVLGKNREQARSLLHDALAVQEAGAFAIVLELVPEQLAAAITDRLRIPTIGIGAGAGCSGQVQVITDLLGIETWHPKHSKPYADLRGTILAAARAYAGRCRRGHVPGPGADGPDGRRRARRGARAAAAPDAAAAIRADRRDPARSRPLGRAVERPSGPWPCDIRPPGRAGPREGSACPLCPDPRPRATLQPEQRKARKRSRNHEQAVAAPGHRPRRHRDRVLRGRWLHLIKTQEGANALQAFSAAQNVKLTYNDQGQLVDHGTTAGAAAIMSLLTNDWGYKVDASEINPNDPLVNTASEYMYQMATITDHTLNATTTVTFPTDVGRDGKVVQARHVRLHEQRQVLLRLRPDQPDRGCGPRQGLDRHGAGPDRPAGRRQRHRLGPPDGPRPRGPLRPRRRHDRPDRPRPGLGDPSRDREGQGSGLPPGGEPRVSTARGSPTRKPTKRREPPALAVRRARRPDAVASAR